MDFLLHANEQLEHITKSETRLKKLAIGRLAVVRLDSTTDNAHCVKHNSRGAHTIHLGIDVDIAHEHVS